MFVEERDELRFAWKDLGDVSQGRPNLGINAPVVVYRLMQFTLRDVLTARYGVEEAGRIFRDAGKQAGQELCTNLLDTSLSLEDFLAQFQQKARDLGIGIVRIEKLDAESLEMTLAVHEDLDCSGLPDSGETVCSYDEGFIAGVLSAYTGSKFQVTEVDCWASGGRVCRFDVKRL